MGTFGELLYGVYDIPRRWDAAKRLRAANGIIEEDGITEADSENALVHALVSASLAHDYSPLDAKLLGSLREKWTSFKYLAGKLSGQDPPDERWDTYKDLYNN